MKSRSEGVCHQENANGYSYGEPILRSLEHLPILILEIIMSFLRPADLVSLAESSPHFEVIVTSSRVWCNVTLQLNGDDTQCFLRQLTLAPEVKQLNFGFCDIDSKAVLDLLRYDGPLPRVRTFCLSLVDQSTVFSTEFLKKYGRTSRHIELDLSHGFLEPPRLTFRLWKILPKLSSVESVAVRIDSVSDVIELNQVAVILVDIDIERLRVDDEFMGGPGSFVGFSAAHLIFQHSSTLETLRLPPTFNEELCRVVTSCKRLHTLACNVSTLSALEHLSNLHKLVVFAPEQVSIGDVNDLTTYVRRSRDILENLKELHFVYSEVTCKILSPLSASDYAQTIVCLLLTFCKSLEVLEVRWDVGGLNSGEHTWFPTVLLNNAPNLRVIQLYGDQLPLDHFRTLARNCSTLQLLDLRRCETGKTRTGCSRRKHVAEFSSRKKKALSLLQKALPKLTVLFDEDGEENCDWNSYVPLQENTEKVKPAKESQSPYMTKVVLSQRTVNELFLHTETLDHWVSGKPFTKEDIPPWRYATLDSSVWSNEEFTYILRAVPALGLLDCRNRDELSPGKKGHQWIKAVANGPTQVEALRIKAVLVPAHLWKLMVPILLRIKRSLRRLDLDFRGRPFREWQDVLSILQELPNLTDFALRGTFKDDKPVFDWLHGHVRSLIRLDIRDCLISTYSEFPEFVKSLRKLLRELRGTLRSVNLPRLPITLAPPVLCTLRKLKDLNEVSIHANDIEYLRPLTSLVSLELYGDRYPRTISLSKLAFRLRNMDDSLKGVRRLTLSSELIQSHHVKEAVFDAMPRLSIFKVIDYDQKLIICAEGPQCKDVISKLF